MELFIYSFWLIIRFFITSIFVSRIKRYGLLVVLDYIIRPPLA